MKILFICASNICRSPAAAAIMRHIISANNMEHIMQADSAGITGMYLPTPPEKMIREAGAQYGYRIDGLSRKVEKEDLQEAHIVITMEDSHYRTIRKLLPRKQRNKVRMFVDFLGDTQLKEIPDPYSKEMSEFLNVIEILQTGCYALFEHLKKEIS